MPFMDDVVKFDRRVLTRKFDGEQFLTSESQGLTVDYYIKWRISDAEQFYQATSGGDEGRAESLVGENIQDGIKNAVAGRTLADIVISDRNEITGEFMAAPAESLRKLGIQLVDVRVQRIDLQEDVATQRLRQHEARLRGHRAHTARRGRPRVAAHPLDGRTPAHRARRQGQCRRAAHPRRRRMPPPRPSTPPRTTAIPSSILSIAACRPTGIRSAAMAT